MKMVSTLALTGVLLSSIFAPNAVAAKKDSELYIVGEYRTPVSENAKIDFIDPALVGTKKVSSSEIGTEGTIGEVYSHSTYSYYTDSITAYDSKPIQNNIFLTSVAVGQTKTYTTNQSNTGTVTIGGTYEENIASVVKFNFTGSYTGSWSSGTGITYTFTAPSCNCNSYNFYSATGYDTYSSVLKKYNVYNVYNGTIKTGTATYYAGTVNVNSVYVPKQVTYGKPATY